MNTMKFILSLILILFIFSTGNSQVAINADGTAGDPSALLDVKSTTRGFLLPRMTTAQRDSIVSPAEGLIIFNTDTKQLNYFNGTTWMVSPGGFVCGQSQMLDIDGNLYNTVQIETQCWMANNLNTGIRIDTSADQTDNGIIERYCYDNLDTNCTIYGGLYTWDEMMQYTADTVNTGICPSGWRLPTTEDIIKLFSFLDAGQEGKALKEAGFQYWCGDNPGDNSSGFTALGAGDISNIKASEGLFIWSHIWLTTNKIINNLQYANRFDMSCPSPQAWIFYDWLATYSFSVRCIKIDN